MAEPQKRDVSVSMEQANIYGIAFALPAAILQVAGFSLVYGIQAFAPTWNLAFLVLAVLLGIFLHELIHGLAWMFFGKKPRSAIQFGFMWKTFSPYAHCTEPLGVGAYRLGTFMPGLLLGILPFVIAMLTGSGDLIWFSLFHTSAACGDWLILWLLRSVPADALVEDHPTRAGCYVIENP